MTTRTTIAFLVAFLAAFLVFGPARAADDDEPEFNDKKLSEWIKQLHEGKKPDDRRVGAICVEQIGHSRSRKVIPALVKAMKEEKDDKTRAAVTACVGRAVAKAFAIAREERLDELPRMDDARNALASRLRTDKADIVREAAAVALGTIGPDARGAASALGAVLKDKNVDVMRAAAAALRRMGKDAKDALADLRTLVADAKADREARIDAAVSIGLVHSDISTTMPILRGLAADKKNSVALRKACIEAIGRMGTEAAGASESLGKILSDDKAPEELHTASASVLASFGKEAKPAIPDLIKAVNDRERLTRCLAMQALSKMGKDLDSSRKDAVKALVKATDDFNVVVRVHALEALTAMAEEGYGGEAENVIKALEKIIKGGSRPEVVAAAKAALEKARPKK